MKQRSRSAILKIAIASAMAAVTATAAFAPGLATGAYPGETGSAPATSSTPTVNIRFSKGKLFFEAPKTVVEGEELQVVNKTNPKQVGPHTFSLVEPDLIPKTAKDRQVCFTKDHICKAVARWHGVKGNGPVKINPVEAGAEGWDTLGSLTTTGDSWFTGEKPRTSIVQRVTAGIAAAGPTQLYFLCAVHPWMHGKITVLPAA